MKILLILTIFLLSIVSCSDNTYYLKYVVFYPNYNDTVSVSNVGEGYYWNCDRGNNYIKEGSITGPTVYAGSAPYKILSYTYTETNIK